MLRWLRDEWDRVVGFSLMALGGVVILAGYHGMSGSAFVADQLSYLMSGGITGLFLLGAGATFVILADLHDEWRKLDRIEGQLPTGVALTDPPQPDE